VLVDGRDGRLQAIGVVWVGDLSAQVIADFPAFKEVVQGRLTAGRAWGCGARRQDERASSDREEGESAHRQCPLSDQ
jgi:hypothetical protein